MNRVKFLEEIIQPLRDEDFELVKDSTEFVGSEIRFKVFTEVNPLSSDFVIKRIKQIIYPIICRFFFAYDIDVENFDLNGIFKVRIKPITI